MSRAPLVLILCTLTIAPPAPARAGERGLLWRVIQTCMANHDLTGNSFPCLEVDTAGGADAGYAVLRAPLEDTHIVVTPTVRTIGIEADRLRGPEAPNYFEDAWAARHFVTDTVAQKLDRSDLALAVNSRPGRSQDQLHIHVDCLRPDVKAALDRQAREIRSRAWTRVIVAPQAPPYWATAIAGADLSQTNLFDLTAKGLNVDADQMADITMVVAGAKSVNGQPGFFVLARQKRPIKSDIAHGEALLDHGCSSLR